MSCHNLCKENERHRLLNERQVDLFIHRLPHTLSPIEQKEKEIVMEVVMTVLTKFGFFDRGLRAWAKRKIFWWATQ